MKKKSRTIVICVLLLLKFSASFGQIDTAFWFAAPWTTPDHWYREPIRIHISTFSAPTTTVRVRQPAAIAPNRYDTTIIIPANTNFDYTFWRDALVSTTNFAFDSLETKPADVVLPYGLYISSTSNITIVYDIITRAPSFFNPETFSLKGQNGLGLEFVCPFQTQWVNQFRGNQAGSPPGVVQPKQQINIVGSKPNTVVWITPKCAVVGHPANISYSIGLVNPGDAYTVENLVQNTNVPGNNLSGTIVVADKPISVTVVDDSVRTGGGGCNDVIGDQIVPVDIVGTNYIINKGAMFLASTEGVYVVATENFTNVKVIDTGTTTTLLNKGDTYFYNITQPLTYVEADKNVYLWQASGIGCEAGAAILPPLNCAGSSLVAFSRTNNQLFYLNILCKNGSQSTFTLNNSAGTVIVPISPAAFAIVPGTSSLTGGPYYGAQINLNSTAVLPIGSYTIANSTDVFALGVFGGDLSTGGLFHYMSSFLRKNVVRAATIAPFCAGQSSSVALTGTVSGAASTGIWTTNGTGTFGPYTSVTNTISVSYFPSVTDLLLSSLDFSLTSLGDCKPVTSVAILAINPQPEVLVPSLASICKNNVIPIALAGTVINTTTNGNGNGAWSVSSGVNGGVFNPPGRVTTYTPSAFDLNLPTNTIILTLTSQGPRPGCFNTSATVAVNFVNPPVVNAGTDLTACTNSTFSVLNGSVVGIPGSGNTGVWTSNGTGLFLPSSSSPQATYQFSALDLTQSQLTLTLSSTNSQTLCNEVSDVIAIKIEAEPIVSVPNNFTVCSIAGIINLTGTITLAGNPPGTWSAPLGAGVFTQNPPASAIYTMGTSDIQNAGVTFVLTSDVLLCPSVSKSFSVAILDAPIVNVNSSNSIVCKNAPITLNGLVSGYTDTGIWSSTGTGSFSPSNTALGGQYVASLGDVNNGNVILTLSSTNNQGCPATSKSFNATFVPAPRAIFSPELKRCKDDAVLFTNSSLANGTSSLTYAWDFGDFTGLSIAQDPLHTYTATGNYVITMTVTSINSFGVLCPDTTSTNIFINPVPRASFDFINGCKNIEAQFRDSSSVFGGSIVGWNWQFGDNSTNANIKNPTHTYTASGAYNAFLTVTSNKLCTATINKQVNVNPIPNAEFGLTNNPAVAQEPIYFSDFSTPTATIKKWVWEFGDGGFDTLQAPGHSYPLAGIYIVTLTVIDDAGCADTVTKSIEVTLLPQVPTAFTPNKDGNNDLLFVKGGPFTKLIFKVYNNWGELLFETNDQKIGWDGTKNGVDQPVGPYVWTLVVDMYNNRQVKKNGDVTLIR
jgi:gliding motility-associated-like protein